MSESDLVRLKRITPDSLREFKNLCDAILPTNEDERDVERLLKTMYRRNQQDFLSLLPDKPARDGLNLRAPLLLTEARRIVEEFDIRDLVYISWDKQSKEYTVVENTRPQPGPRVKIVRGQDHKEHKERDPPSTKQGRKRSKYPDKNRDRSKYNKNKERNQERKKAQQEKKLEKQLSAPSTPTDREREFSKQLDDFVDSDIEASVEADSDPPPPPIEIAPAESKKQEVPDKEKIKMSWADMTDEKLGPLVTRAWSNADNEDEQE